MRAIAWRIVEWQLRHLPALQRITTLGDLEEDFERQRRAVGAIRATFWLLAESPRAPARQHPLAPRPWYQRLRSWLETSQFQPRGDGSFGHFYPQGG